MYKYEIAVRNSAPRPAVDFYSGSLVAFLSAIDVRGLMYSSRYKMHSAKAFARFLGSLACNSKQAISSNKKIIERSLAGAARAIVSFILAKQLPAPRPDPL